MVEQKDLQLAHLQKHGINTQTVLNQPVGLFVLFFTEMWERFSYYGMRALLTLFLISQIADGGWNWSNEDALRLYGLYTGLVYLTPLIGGIIADKLMGYRKAIVLGAIIMTLGHVSLAMEAVTDNFFYLGLVLLILGNGLFKPNIASMVGQLYPSKSDVKDAAYTIFYMGVNGGAFLGILLCGYIGEEMGWHWGFGLAGVFMFFGMLQFLFGQGIFGNLGKSPKEKPTDNSISAPIDDETEAKLPKKVVTQRIIVIGIFSFFTIFFWMVFEQAGGSMTIFSEAYTDRFLEGNAAVTFKWIDAILTIVPLIIITWVLAKLASKIIADYPLTIIFTGLSFLIIWGIAIWKVDRQFSEPSTEVAASWFNILNSFFIISLAPLFSKLWESKYNPSGPVKFAIGLMLVGIGFGALAYGGRNIAQGAAVAHVSMIWLILAYFFHTLGELFVSPVGLSYVSKLSPQKLIGLMFGIWYLSNFLGNLAAGFVGSLIDTINANYSISIFFLLFTALPIIAGLLMLALSPLIKKWMHGIH